MKSLILVVAAAVMTGSTLGSVPSISSFKEVAGPGCIVDLLSLNGDISTPAKPKYLSPSTLLASPDYTNIYIGCETGKQVKIFDIATKTVKDSLLLPDEVTGMAITPDGATLIVTCSSKRWPAGKICFVDVAAKKTVATVYTGFGARSPVLTPDGKKLYVCNQFSNDVSVIEVFTRSVTAKIPMVREPYCAAITPDGKTVVVGNLLPADLSTDSNTIAAEVTLIDTANKTTAVKLVVGSHSVRGVTVTPDGKYALVTHFRMGFGLLGATVAAGRGGTSACTVIDIAAGKPLATTTLDQATKGSADVWAVKCSKDGKFLVTTHAGSHEVSVIDYPKFIDSVHLCIKNGIDMRRNFNYIPFIRVFRSTTSLSPRAIEIVGDNLYTTGIFSDVPLLEEFPLSMNPSVTGVGYQLAQPVASTPEHKGEALFYDARICYQQWRSCNSCHPFGGSSGLYNILNSGIAGYPRNVKGLLYSWWTPPTTWNGRRADVHESNLAAIQLELFMMPQDSNVNTLDAFLKNLQPTQSPVLEKGRLTASADRGKALFMGEKAGCAKCHVPPLFANDKMYNVGIPDPFDPSPMNTPSLIECWKTAPYGHLGSIGTVREMIRLPGMSGGSTLTDEEVTDLEKYVLSL